jgi:hypothetical protein
MRDAQPHVDLGLGIFLLGNSLGFTPPHDNILLKDDSDLSI